MLRMTGWVLGGFLTMALWVPGVGAQPGGQSNRDFRHDWRDMHHDRQDISRDRWDIRQSQRQFWHDRRAGDAAAGTVDRRALQRNRAHFWTDRRALHRDWHEMHHHHYSRW